jgi:hypothetical protein
VASVAVVYVVISLLNQPSATMSGALPRSGMLELAHYPRFVILMGGDTMAGELDEIL